MKALRGGPGRGDAADDGCGRRRSAAVAPSCGGRGSIMQRLGANGGAAARRTAAQQLGRRRSGSANGGAVESSPCGDLLSSLRACVKRKGIGIGRGERGWVHPRGALIVRPGNRGLQARYPPGE
jgi:hypothetical protein